MEAYREPMRGVALSVSNAVFSKLVKLGRDKGQTTQKAAQALFDAAYEAECLGTAKAKPADKPAIVIDDKERQARDALMGEMIDQLQEICTRHGCLGGTPRVPWIGETMDAWAARIAQLEAQANAAAQTQAFTTAELEEARQAAHREAGDIAGLETRLANARQVIAGKDQMLLAQAEEIRDGAAALAEAKRISSELSSKCWNAEAERDRLRGELAELMRPGTIYPGEVKPGAIIQVIEPPPLSDDDAARFAQSFMAHVGPPPTFPDGSLVEPPPRRERIPVLLIQGMKAAGNSPAEIARELGLGLATVHQVLG